MSAGARTGDVVVASLGDAGVLVLDPPRRRVHALDPVTSAVWGCCDGRPLEAVVDAAVALGIEPAWASDAVAALDGVGLLDGTHEPPQPVAPPPPAVAAVLRPDRSPPFGALRSTASEVGVLDVAGHTVRLRCDDELLAAHLRHSTAPLARRHALDGPHRPGVLDVALHVAPASSGGLSALFVDGELVAQPGDRAGLVAALWLRLNRLAAAAPGRLVLHAAVLERDGRLLVVPAPPDSGKSTLALALVQAGFAYLGDEAAGFEHGTGRFVPYRKPVTLDRGSHALFGALGPDAAALALDGGRWHLDVAAIGGGEGATSVACTADDVAGVVVRRFRRGVVIREALDARHGALALAENAFDLWADPAAAAPLIARIVDGTRVVRVEGDDLGAAVDDCLAVMR